jgi:hypothetical protein
MAASLAFAVVSLAGGVLLEAADLVGRSHENFYVSDEAAAEVYLMHHHDKVVVSVPDPAARQQLLVELDRLADIFEDRSGYGTSEDADNDPDPDAAGR